MTFPSAHSPTTLHTLPRYPSGRPHWLCGGDSQVQSEDRGWGLAQRLGPRSSAGGAPEEFSWLNKYLLSTQAWQGTLPMAGRQLPSLAADQPCIQLWAGAQRKTGWGAGVALAMGIINPQIHLHCHLSKGGGVDIMSPPQLASKFTVTQCDQSSCIRIPWEAC